jgi:acyl dehydratase
MQVGDILTVTDGPITREQIKEYAKASGDTNPIHTDEEYASTKGGLNGVIAHGMLFYGFVIRTVNKFAMDNKAKLNWIKAEMRGMVRPGDLCVINLKVTAIDGNKISISIEQNSLMPLKAEKDGKVIAFEGETRGWVKEKEKGGVKTIDAEMAGKVGGFSLPKEAGWKVTLREWIAIRGTAEIELK